MSSQEQINLISYRNGIYQGYLKSGNFHNLGAILTQDFLYNLSIWKNGEINGPSLTIYPNQHIFYGNFMNNYPEGLCCYVIGNQCQIYCQFNDKQMEKYMIAVFPIIQVILHLNIGDKQQISYNKEIQYTSNEQKWDIIQKIMNKQIGSNYRKFNKFIKNQIIDKYDFKEIQQVYGQEYYIGFKGINSIGIKFDLQKFNIKSVGIYDRNSMLQEMGKKIINKQKRIKQQGIYNNPQTLIRYQQRPQKIKKIYRDFFRLSLNFQNKFLQLSILQKIQKQFDKLKIKIKDSTTKRIAQQLIQHLQPQQLQQQNINNIRQISPIKQKQPINSIKNTRYHPNLIRAVYSQSQSNSNSHSNNNPHVTSLPSHFVNDKDYYHGGKMTPQVSIQELKQQIKRSKSHKKSYTKSPYKQFQKQPAQLKYTSKIMDQTELKNNYKPNKYNISHNNSKYNNDSYSQILPQKNNNSYKNYENPYKPIRFNTDTINLQKQLQYQRNKRDKQLKKQRERSLQRMQKLKQYKNNDNLYNNSGNRVSPYKYNYQHQNNQKYSSKQYPYKQITRQNIYDNQGKSLSKYQTKYTPNEYKYKYKYIDENNPQKYKNQLLPQRIYNNINKYDNSNLNDRTIISQKYNKPKSNNYIQQKLNKTYNYNDRIDKMSTKYDQLQNKQGNPDNKITLNNGRGYKFSNTKQQIDKQLGIKKVGRKVQQPIRKSPSRSISNNKIENKSPSNPYTYANIYRNKYKNEGISNFGYFENNKQNKI